MTSAPARTLFLPILLLAAFGLRVARLDATSLWHDEVSGVEHSLQSFQDITLWNAAAEPHPPLHYYILHLWLQAAGSSEYAARFPSVVFGVLTLPVLYGLLRKLTTPRRALLGALALTASAFHIYYSQEARMHVEACFFCVAAAWALLLALERGKWWLWLSYGVLAATGMYVFYYVGLALLAINLPVLFRRRLWSRGWWLANAGALALLAPWAQLVLRITHRFAGEPLPGGPPAAPADLARAVTGYAFGLTAAWPASAGPAALLLAALLACSWRLVRRGRPADQMLLLWAFLTPLVSYFGTLLVVGSADNSPRLALSSLPAWIAVLVCGWPDSWPLARVTGAAQGWPGSWLAWLSALVRGWSERRWLSLAAWASAAVLLAAPTAAALAANYAGAGVRDDYRAVFARLRAQALPDQALVYDVPDQVWALDYYFPHPNLATAGLPSTPSDSVTDAQLAQLAARHTGVWALLYGEPRPWVERWLDAHLIPVSDQWYGPYARLKRYAPAPLPPGQSLPGATRVDADFGPLRLAQVEMGHSQALPLELLWQATAPISADLTRSLQLFDEAGHRVAQSDSPPLEGAVPTSKWRPGQGYVESLALQPARPLAPGLYTLRTTVYDSAGTASPLQRVLRLPVLAASHTVDLDARSDAGWSVQSLTYGAGAPGELLVEVTGSVQSSPTSEWTWFAHVVDRDGRLLAQDDHPPLAAATSWRPGDQVREAFRLPSAAADGLSLELGAYDAAGRRAELTTGRARADHVTVPLSLSDLPQRIQ